MSNNKSRFDLPIEVRPGRKVYDKPPFSILIPSWNNLPMLQLCIASIEKNSRYRHQIVVHVNEGADGTAAWVAEAGFDHTFSRGNAGVCYALNAARGLAVADYLVYINDDMYVCPGWDETLLEEIGRQPDEKFYLSSTAIEPRDVGKKIAIAPYDFGPSPEGFDEAGLLKHYAEPSFEDWCGSSWPPAVVHRAIWDAVGGYSVEFSPGMYSDPDFSMKLWRAGVRRFKGVAASRVYHFLESSTKHLKGKTTNDASRLFLRKWGITSRAFYRFYLRMGEPYRELTPPRLTAKYIWKMTLCKLKKTFMR